MDNKELVLKLAYCEREDEVIELLTEIGLWENSDYWRPFGDVENNWSTIGNQQSEAESALVEKIVNSIDAMLMKECLVRGISPESSQAPKSIAEAMEEYFGIKGGKLQDISQSDRTKLARSIILTASGNKPGENSGSPCITIVDSGEGQTPNKMPDTILSINRANKLKVPFVQGKFNMGGTGVLRFCGDNCLQLIISKRCPKIPDSDGDETFSKWGFTIIRRERPKHGVDRRSSMFTYLVNDDNKIRSFVDDKGIDVIPTSKGGYATMEHGMYCRMYEYRMSPGVSTNINMRFYNRMSTLLPSLAYPVYLDECRSYDARTMFRTLSGLNVRLSDHSANSEASNIEDTLSASFTIDGQKIGVSVYVFKKTTKKGTDLDMLQFRADEGILLTQNGQTHGNFDRRFYRRNAVNLSYLADHLITIVDCTNIDEATREDLFMNSRDRMSGGSFGKKLESYLEEYFKENDTLKQIQQRRREEALARKLDDNKPLEDVLSSIFKSSKVLSKLFALGERLQNPTNLGSTTIDKEFNGRYNPTYFEVVKKQSMEKLKREVQLGRKFRITFKTDANNDFFSREDYPGDYSLCCEGTPCYNHGMNLHNGTATLSVSLPDSSEIGDTYQYECVTVDTNVDREFNNDFEIKIVPAVANGNSPNPPQPPKPPGPNPDDKTTAPTGISLPEVKEVYQNEWEDYQFSKESALKVVRAAAETETFDFYVNMDNIHLLTEMKPLAKDENKIKLFKARYKYSMVLVGLSVLGYYSNKKEDESQEEMVSLLSEMVSPIILPMIDVLGSDMNEILQTSE